MFGSVIGNVVAIGNPPSYASEYIPKKGAILRVGTIPSTNSCPQAGVSSDDLQIHDGGLASLVGSGTNVYWIGPDGTFIQNNKNNMPLFADVENTIWGGGWFDPIQNMWGSIPGVNDPSGRLPGTQGYTYLQDGNFKYSSFYNKNIQSILNSYYKASPNWLLYTPGNTGNVPNYIGNYPFNMTYGGIDTFIVNSFVYSSEPQWSAVQVLTPLGDSLAGITGYAAGVSPSVSYAPVYNDGPYITFTNLYLIGFQISYMNSPVYWLNGKMFITGCSIAAYPNQAIGYYDSQQNLHYAFINETSTYSKAFVGRLWNGFVYKNVFSDYLGCCYTEDLITFYPLKDITGQVDFTQHQNFGTYTSNGFFSFFMSGFGYSYLAVYNNNNLGVLTQAAYKIYPVFNFTPMVPDSFFIPSVCGCNRRSNRA